MRNVLYYSTVHLIFILLAVQGQQKCDNSKYALMFKFQMLEKIIKLINKARKLHNKQSNMHLDSNIMVIFKKQGSTTICRK